RSPVRTRRPRACISSLVLLRTGNWELSCTLLRHHLRIGREREQREILAVQVVLQVEHAREARAGEESLVPGTVFILRSQKIGHAAGYAFAARIAYGQQSHDCPRGLRRRALALPSKVRIVVRSH